MSKKITIAIAAVIVIAVAAAMFLIGKRETNAGSGATPPVAAPAAATPQKTSADPYKEPDVVRYTVKLKDRPGFRVRYNGPKDEAKGTGQ